MLCALCLAQILRLSRLDGRCCHVAVVFAQVKIVEYVRRMLVRSAVNPSRRPFDPAVLGKLADADPVVQEAVVCHTSLDGTHDIEYPNVLGWCHACAVDFRNASARLKSNIRKMATCFEWGPHLDALAVVRCIHTCSNLSQF
jgi:hypothetical protein